MLLRATPARLLFLVCVLLPTLAAAQPDTTDYSIETSFKVYPTPLWSRSAGFAAGVGYEIENLVFPKTSILASVKPGQHLGRYSLRYVARDPYEDRVYGLANVYYETAGRKWYYGMNPTSSKGDQIAVEKNMFVVDLRLGVRPFNRLLLLQPSVRFVRHDVNDFRSFEEGALTRLSVLSQRYLRYSIGLASGSSSLQEGFALGVSAGMDLTDRQVRPRKGLLVQGSVHRYLSTNTQLRFDRYEGYGYFFLPVNDNTLRFRLVMMIIDPKSEEPIPFYFHPTLDSRLLPGYTRNRFFANDLLVATAEYTLPLFQLLDFAALDALISLGAGNVYLDVFRHFKPAISFDRDVGEGATYPLRPSAALGLNIQSFDAGGWDMRVLLGWGTEGVRLVQFGFVQDVRDFELQ